MIDKYDWNQRYRKLKFHSCASHKESLWKFIEEIEFIQNITKYTLSKIIFGKFET